ncbi:MAG: aspartyl protease family protein [Gemmataceae bacterium]
MRFPYTEVKPGIFRPIANMLISGPAGTTWTDGLLDTGADRTVLTMKIAQQLGIDVLALTEKWTVASATGQNVSCKITRLPFLLFRKPKRVTWLAEVAIAIEPIQRPLWGFKGFLEYFRVTFDGPKRLITLNPGRNLPSTIPTS